MFLMEGQEVIGECLSAVNVVSTLQPPFPHVCFVGMHDCYSFQNYDAMQVW
jgi:hypothetical protein